MSPLPPLHRDRQLQCSRAHKNACLSVEHSYAIFWPSFSLTLVLARSRIADVFGDGSRIETELTQRTELRLEVVSSFSYRVWQNIQVNVLKIVSHFFPAYIIITF
jgi:hypothetical protein